MFSENDLLCRLCMMQLYENGENWVELFPKKYINSDSKDDLARLTRAIKSCYNIEIVEKDGLPSVVCQSCVEMLQMFYQAKLFVNGVNNAYNKTRNFGKLFKQTTLPTKIDDEIKASDESENLVENLECEMPVVEEKKKKDIGTVIDPANILPPQNKREKRPVVFTDRVQKFKKFKQLNNIVKKRGRPKGSTKFAVTKSEACAKEPPLVNGESVEASEEIDVVTNGTEEVTIDYIKASVAEEATKSSNESDSTVVSENDTEKRAFSGRKLKPVCRDDFVIA